MKKRSWDEIRAKQLLGEGYTDSEIADAVGASVNAIKAWRYKNGFLRNIPHEKRAAVAVPEDPAATETDAPVEAPAVVETAPPVEAHTDTDGDTEGKGHNPCPPPCPVEITFSFNGCTVSLSTPDLPSAAWAAAYLNTVVRDLHVLTDNDLSLKK